MFAAKNVADQVERHRRLVAFTNNLIVLLALLVLGFPVTPATIRTTVAGWAIVAVATLQFAFRRIGPQVHAAPIRTIRELASGINTKP